MSVSPRFHGNMPGISPTSVGSENGSGPKRPRILTSDPDCKTTVVYTKFSETVDVPSQYPCGTVELTRRWNVSDTCGQSDYVDQFIYLQPRSPIWPENPWNEAVSDINCYHKMYDLDLFNSHLRLSFRNSPFQPQLVLLAPR